MHEHAVIAHLSHCIRVLWCCVIYIQKETSVFICNAIHVYIQCWHYMFVCWEPSWQRLATWLHNMPLMYVVNNSKQSATWCSFVTDMLLYRRQLPCSCFFLLVYLQPHQDSLPAVLIGVCRVDANRSSQLSQAMASFFTSVQNRTVFLLLRQTFPW